MIKTSYPSNVLRAPTLAFLLFLSLQPATAQEVLDADPLPRHETEEERALRRWYTPPVGTHTAPPAGDVRTMAEFEELEGIIIRWVSSTSRSLLLSQIVDAAQEEGSVWILVSPGSSDSTWIKEYLQGLGVPLKSVEFISANTNSIWSRDYGPWTVYNAAGDSIGFVDFVYNRPRPQDDIVPATLAARWGIPLYQTTTMPDSLVFTGGNFMVDGFGTGFASSLVTIENPLLAVATTDSIMRRYCGLRRFIRMDTLLFDGIHHIDMHIKLLDEETLLIGQYPVNVSDYATIEHTVDALRTLSTCYGRPYRIIRIPMPPSLSGEYPPASSYYTYTNSLIVNRSVLVPIYGFPLDADALDIYRRALPGYTIVGYDCNAIIGASGAIHCITKEVGVREPIHIAHARLLDTENTGRDHRVEASITVRSGADSVLLWWSADSAGGFQRITMKDSGGTFAGFIPRQQPGTNIRYYLEVLAQSGHRITKPLPGEAGPCEFHVGPMTTSAAERQLPEAPLLHQNYPNPFNASTTIRYHLSRRAEVELAVFTLLGERVETLFRGRQEPGSYHAVWNARQQASGVYFTRLSATDETGSVSRLTRKAFLVK